MPLRLAALFVIALAAACAPRGTLVFDPTPAAGGTRQQLFVATSRALDGETAVYGTERVQADNYARFVVQIPPDRSPGEINWPPRNRPPDPSRDFVTVERDFYATKEAFRDDLARALKALPPGQREVRVFAHGFNVTFAEGLYRLAQLDKDYGFPGISVHYAWPSAGKPLGYFGDRDSAIFSRDGYEDLLIQLVDAGAERVILVGHSMGALLTMEGLRQISISGNDRVFDKIGGVVLISPDIAVDVFQKTARRIGRLPQPFFVFTSTKDRALKLSAALSGRPERLGNLENAEPVSEFDVTVIDVSAFSREAGHFTLGDSPALISILGSMSQVEAAFGGDRGSRYGVLAGTVMTFRNAQEVVILPQRGRPGERD